MDLPVSEIGVWGRTYWKLGLSCGGRFVSGVLVKSQSKSPGPASSLAILPRNMGQQAPGQKKKAQQYLKRFSFPVLFLHTSRVGLAVVDSSSEQLEMSWDILRLWKQFATAPFLAPSGGRSSEVYSFAERRGNDGFLLQKFLELVELHFGQVPWLLRILWKRCSCSVQKALVCLCKLVIATSISGMSIYILRQCCIPPAKEGRNMRDWNQWGNQLW